MLHFVSHAIGLCLKCDLLLLLFPTRTAETTAVVDIDLIKSVDRCAAGTLAATRRVARCPLYPVHTINTLCSF
jgi:hypothetical protein